MNAQELVQKALQLERESSALLEECLKTFPVKPRFSKLEEVLEAFPPEVREHLKPQLVENEVQVFTEYVSQDKWDMMNEAAKALCGHWIKDFNDWRRSHWSVPLC